MTPERIQKRRDLLGFALGFGREVLVSWEGVLEEFLLGEPEGLLEGLEDSLG